MTGLPCLSLWQPWASLMSLGVKTWLYEDVQPTTSRCPACWGEGECGMATHPLEQPCICSTCEGAGYCDPLPAKGRQGIWRWTP